MNICRLSKRVYSTQKSFVIPKICIVGGGPAGFYTAQHLIKNVTNAEIDIIERLPVPFGLVRFGVAPDHPEVKNVINTFTKTAQNPKVRFIGNINLGSAIKISQLREAYHAIILTYGAEKDRNLGIPGEELKNVISARNIVGWYNGIPWNSNLEIDLNGKTAVIIGQGNVAVDVARILLTPVDILKTTDITEHALEALMSSKIREVYLVGRRGPLQAAFTIKELREMLKLQDCHTKWNAEDFIDIPNIVQQLTRPKKRIVELMLSSLNACPAHKASKYFIPKFLRTPLKFSGSGKVSTVTLGANTLIGNDLLAKSTQLTDQTEEIQCNLAVRSIGYKSIKVDEDIPFDSCKGVVVHNAGKVDNGLYTAGWLATGPTGVILTTMGNSFEIANNMSSELLDNTRMNNLLTEDKPGYNRLKELIREKNLTFVTWQGWQKIDAYEQEEGKKVGKPREKIISIEKMLDIGGIQLQ